MRMQGITQRAMAQMRGTSYGGSSHFAFAPSRAVMVSYAELLESRELTHWASSDLFWDRVVARTPDGEEDVYDLTVPGPASWLADGIVSHNSGAIEQDADMILLIYREEDATETLPPASRIDLVKHRNGEIGTSSSDLPGPVHALGKLRTRLLRGRCAQVSRLIRPSSTPKPCVQPECHPRLRRAPR
jgi:replicative DNA helicase